jgi:hypothetical protein
MKFLGELIDAEDAVFVGRVIILLFLALIGVCVAAAIFGVAFAIFDLARGAAG